MLTVFANRIIFVPSNLGGCLFSRSAFSTKTLLVPKINNKCSLSSTFYMQYKFNQFKTKDSDKKFLIVTNSLYRAKKESEYQRKDYLSQPRDKMRHVPPEKTCMSFITLISLQSK